MKRVSFLTICLFFLASCGGSGSKPLPTVNLTATPTSLVLGNTSTFSWTSTNANSCSALWTSQTLIFGTEEVTIDTLGNNTYSISCVGDGGTISASVIVEAYRETDGVVVDGYISGAEVCIDEDDSWTCDANENATTSDNEGKFTIRYANGNLISIGGADLDSQTLLDNLLITHKLTGHSDFKAVTPVTSVAAFMQDSSGVNEAIGIDSSIDVFTFDPVANKGDGGIYDYLYEKGNQLTVLAYALQNITNNFNATTETTQDYFKAITEEIEKEYTETETKVDIETETFITKALDNVIAAKALAIDETAKANTTKALAGVMPVIEVKSSDDLTTAVIRFAVSTLQTDIQAIANGTATAEIVISYTEDILTYIAEDQNIDADEIAPDITAIADTSSTTEDTAVEINVLLNDSYLTSAPISVTAGNGSDGTTGVASNIITYEPDADYNGTDTFSYTITQGDKTSSAEVTVTINAVNDAPSIDTASTIQVAENQTAVTTFSVSDVDEDDLTLTLAGTDADSFNLSSENVLTFKEAPDYETKTSYSITLTLTDGFETVTKDITINVTNVNDVAPVFTSEATFSATENQTAIGTVTATDAEGDAVTFTVSGSELAITSAGVLTFASTPNYETKTTYTATLTASDGVNSATQDITINVTNVIDIAPIFLSLPTTIIVDENTLNVYQVKIFDEEGEKVTYSLSGADAEQFNLSEFGLISFKNAKDYESTSKKRFDITITISNGALSQSRNAIVIVKNLNENQLGESSLGNSKLE
jgi:serralysin